MGWTQQAPSRNGRCPFNPKKGAMDPTSENPDDLRKRKRDPSVAPSLPDVPSPGDIGSDVAAFRSGQAVEGLSGSTAPLDVAALPTARVSKLPNFVAAPNNSRFFLTPDVPVNRATFRYTPAGAAEPGKLVLHRSIENAPTTVRFSWEDRSPHIRISQDGLTIEGFGGFRSARCNVPVREGKWYVEFIIERAEDTDGQNLGKHVRIGWARREASLNGPVGLDGYSYGLRDVTGDCVTLSKLRPYGRPFKQGDVVGMYISLPPKRHADPNDPLDPARLLRKRIPIGLKLQPYFETAEYPISREMKALSEQDDRLPPPVTSGKKRKVEARPAKNVTTGEQGPLRPLPVLEGSVIAYFINGECQGTAFTDIYDYLQLRETTKRKAAKDRQALNLKERHNPFDDGTLGYYPMVSLYHEAVVRLNAGPDFQFPPPDDIDAVLGRVETPSMTRTWKPLSDRYEQFVAETFELDDLEEEMAKERLANKDIEIISVDPEKAAQREKRRKRDEARRKAKKEGAQAASARGNSASTRAHSGTPQPLSSQPGSTPQIPASTPAANQLDATPPLSDTGFGAQKRAQSGDHDGYGMYLDVATSSREPSALRDLSSGSSPMPVKVEGGSPAIQSPMQQSREMEVDE